MDGLNSNKIDNAISTITNTNSFERLTVTCKAIGAAIRRSHVRKEQFFSYQNSLNVHKSTLTDFPTRFDSTVDMFESISKNKAVLQRMQEKGDGNPITWPLGLNLTTDDFDMFESNVEVLQPVKIATKHLS